LQKLGGAQVILATAPSAKAMSELVAGLRPNGKLLAIGATTEPLSVSPFHIIPTSLSLIGRYAATAAGEEDTARFAELTGVRPMIETFPFEKAAEGYARMKSGQAKFRVVLTM
jgi:D-arabinose 1-dehydrogenase-like Zn-dependent alcohol dehydrogenase